MPGACGRDPAVHLIRPGLRGLSHDPTDGLPDEELGLLEHRVRAARERLERSTVLQRRQFREQRRPSDPEVVVASPPIQRASDRGLSSPDVPSMDAPAWAASNGSPEAR